MKIGDLSVNDNRGLYDNAGLCDSLVTDCNNVVKNVCSGQYLQFCNLIVQMVQKLTNLKSGIIAEAESKNSIIEELKQQAKNAKDGAEDGSN